MHSSTKNKIDSINQFLRRNGKKLVQKYSNVNGVYIERRIRGDEVVNRFCIVFHVEAKKPLEEVKKKIPAYIDVPGRIGGRKVTYKVPTDVRAVGKPKMQTYLISSQGGLTVSKGTLTGFVERDGAIYYISNMHVLGMPYIHDEEYDVEDDTEDLNVKVEGRSICAFRKGLLTLSGEFDVARCEKLKNHSASEAFDLDTLVLVPEDDLTYVMEDPIWINCYGHQNETYGAAQIINVVPGPVDFDLDGSTVSLTNLLLISPVITDAGDSGALIFDNEQNAYGLIVGADDVNSYAINLNKAINYLF